MLHKPHPTDIMDKGAVEDLVQKLKENDAMEYTTVVNAGASESAPLLHINTL